MRQTLILVLLLAGPHQELLAQPEINLRSGPDGGVLCHMSIPTLTSRTWQIVALPNNLGGVQGAEFRVTGMPEEYVHVITPNPDIAISLGNPLEFGCNVAFSTCQTATEVVLYTIETFNPGTGGSSQLQVEHIATPSEPVWPNVNACDAPLYTTHWASGGTLSLNENAGTAPATPSPTPGATDVALDGTLSWERGAADHPCSEDGAQQRLYLGVGIDPPLIATLEGQATAYDVSALAANTTYAWRVEVVHGGYALSSPLWHFSTVSSVAIDAVSWSTIKLLYDATTAREERPSP